MLVSLWLPCCCCCWVTSVVSDYVRPHRRQPTRLPWPWDSPGKNTGAGCHFLLQCMKVKSESEVAQSCLTLHDPMDCCLPGSSIHGIFQARVLEWGAIAFSGGCHKKALFLLCVFFLNLWVMLRKSFIRQLWKFYVYFYLGRWWGGEWGPRVKGNKKLKLGASITLHTLGGGLIGKEFKGGGNSKVFIFCFMFL